MIYILIFLQLSTVKILDLQKGKGNVADYGATLTVHYKGFLKSNGKEFDNSYKKGEAIVIVLGKSSVIEGWHLGLLGVQKGSIRRLIIPPKYGYGAQNLPNIPANSTLVFDVEVLDLKMGDHGWEIPKDMLPNKKEHVIYYDLEIGNGEKAKKDNKVSYHYKLYDKNKMLLYNTRKNNKLESIRLGEKKHMIQGLENALYGMKVGGKRKLICNGPFGNKDDLFIFDLELIKVE